MDVKIKTALISVSDKTGVVEFAVARRDGGQNCQHRRHCQNACVKQASRSRHRISTGFPEMMDGRVKTLHPKIHGGLLAIRDNADHTAAMKKHGIERIDLVCVNLYPFEQTVQKPL